MRKYRVWTGALRTVVRWATIEVEDELNWERLPVMDRRGEKENELCRPWPVEFVGSSGLSLRYGLCEAVEKVPMGRASAPPT